MMRPARKRIVQFVGAALALALLAGLPAGESAAAAGTVTADPVIRVGLFYGSTALDGANLLNDVGSGYRLGYYDRQRVFQTLAQTAEEAVSVVKTQNVYYGTGVDWSGSGYYDSPVSDVMVGCWHIVLPGSYASFQEAQTAADAYSGGFAAWIDGVWQARVGAYGDQTEAQAALAALGLSGASVAGTSAYGVSVGRTGTNQILFQFDDSSGALCLGIQPGQDDSVKTETIFRGNTYYGGFQYQRVNGGDLTVSSVLTLDDYIQGVIVREMSSSWPLEALKAQAVCARTYAYRNYAAQRHSSQGFDLCNTVHCQAYSGMSEVTAESSRAVTETHGEYLWYDGELIDAVYFSSDGGATESSENVWGGELPYLVGKEDPYEAYAAEKIPNYNWTVTFTAQELTDLLNEKGYKNSGIVDFRVTRTTSTGNVAEITFTDSSGKSWSKVRDDCRTFLGLRSLRYTVTGGSGAGGYPVNSGGSLGSLAGAYALDGSGNAVPLTGGTVYAIGGDGTVGAVQPAASGTSSAGVFTISGSGWGHSVGMSQWGAYAMAMQGYGYQDILNFYYTGIEVHTP